jgi:hypothetical protein
MLSGCVAGAATAGGAAGTAATGGGFAAVAAATGATSFWDVLLSDVGTASEGLVGASGKWTRATETLTVERD